MTRLVTIAEDEELLKGKVLTKELALEAADLAVRDAHPMYENSYKVQEIRQQIIQSLGF